MRRAGSRVAGALLCALLAVSSALAPPAFASEASDAERDDILMLSAYSIAAHNWGSIGAVAAILTRDGRILSFGLNHSRQSYFHAEMDMIARYTQELGNKAGPVNLHGMTAYVTLQPCMMCYGTLRVLHAGRVVYGQDYKGGQFHLDVDSSPTVYSPMRLDAAKTPFKQRLERSYETQNRSAPLWVGQWFVKGEAERIMDEAACAFEQYKVKNRENNDIYKAARDYVKQVGGEVRFPCSPPPVF